MQARWTAQDGVLLQEARRRSWIERLVSDLGRVGDSREAVEKWLGAPLREMTAEEHQRLSDYVERSREAIAQKKTPPFLAPNKRPALSGTTR